MNKRTKWIAGWALGLSMAVGAGAAVSLLSARAKEADAGTVEKFLKISKTDGVVAGKTVVLGYESSQIAKELKAIEKSGSAFIGTVQDFVDAPSGVYRLTVEEGSEKGSFSFKHGDNYLTWTSGNTLNVSNTKDSNSSWVVTIANGLATIKNVADDARKLQYNSTYPRFATYSGSQQLPSLYELVSMDASKVDGVKLDQNFVLAKAGVPLSLVATVSPQTAENKTVTWSSSDPEVATVSDGTVTPLKKGTTRITVTTNDGGYTAFADVAFTDHTGTESDPLSILDVDIIKGICSESATVDKYFVSGTVKSVAYTANHRANITLAENENEMVAYNCYDSDGHEITDETLVLAGDVVLLKTAFYGTSSYMRYGNVMQVQRSVTVTSISVAGELLAPQYVGEPWDLTGLSVKALLSDDSEIDVSNSSELSYSPAAPTAAGAQKVSVTATYDDKQVTRQVDVNVIAPTETSTAVITSGSFDFPEGTKNGYGDFTGTLDNGVTIAGNINYAKDIAFIQIRSTNNNSGVITTSEFGRAVKNVAIAFNGGNTPGDVQLFAEAEAFAIEDMYGDEIHPYAVLNASKLSINVPVGTKYIGIRSSNNARYLDSITVTYFNNLAEDAAAKIKTLAGGWDNPVATNQCAAHYSEAKTFLLGLSEAQLNLFKNSADNEIASARATYEYWCAVNGDNTPYTGAVALAAHSAEIGHVNSNAWLIGAIAIMAGAVAIGTIIAAKKRKQD